MTSNPHVTRGRHLPLDPFNENGKRERIDQDDDPEVVPLSKRMNNIHFDGGVNSGQPSSASHHSRIEIPNGQMQRIQEPGFSQNPNIPVMEHGHYSQPSPNGQNDLNGFSNGINNSTYHPSASNTHNGYATSPSSTQHFNMRQNEATPTVPSPKDINYSPVLDRDANPHYYDQNRILFELYRERLERNNFPPHPNYCEGGG